MRSLKCSICGGDAELRFTSGKGKPYISCKEHVLQAAVINRSYRKRNGIIRKFFNWVW